MEVFNRIDTIKNLLTQKAVSIPDFDPLLHLLQKIQKQGKIPTLSQVEDQLPINVYNGTKPRFSFKEYIYRAERAKIVHVNRNSTPAIIIALQQPITQSKSYLSSVRDLLPTSGLQMPNMGLPNLAGKLKQLYNPRDGYKKVDPTQEKVPLMVNSNGDLRVRRKNKLDQFEEFL